MAYAGKYGFTDDLRALPERALAFGTAAGLQANRDAGCTSEPPTRCGESLDVSLAQAIGRRLQESPFLPLRKVACEELDGRVILRGRVPTQYLHALACSLAQSFDGVREVANKIEVVPLGLPYAPAALREI